MSQLFSPLLERALRFAADRHRNQTRKATDIPYITHPISVAWILQRAGFDDEVLLAAALLHDVIEDCGVSRDELGREFDTEVADIVAALSERKLDDSGQPRPWEDRKREHLSEMAGRLSRGQPLTLADKLHNLEAIALDQASGVDVWSRFNAPRERLLWYYRSIVAACETEDPRTQQPARACRDVLDRLDGPAIA